MGSTFPDFGLIRELSLNLEPFHDDGTSDIFFVKQIFNYRLLIAYVNTK